MPIIGPIADPEPTRITIGPTNTQNEVIVITSIVFVGLSANSLDIISSSTTDVVHSAISTLPTSAPLSDITRDTRGSSFAVITTTDASGETITKTAYTFVEPEGSSQDRSQIIPSPGIPPSPSASSGIASSSPTGLTTSTKAGIGIGAVIAVILIAIIAFWLGRRGRRTQSALYDGSASAHVAPSAEFDGQGRSVGELEGHGVWRWSSVRPRNTGTVEFLNAGHPQELPANEIPHDKGSDEAGV